MIVVCDINEVWRRKPFAALAEQTDVLGVSPADWLVARRRGFQSSDGVLEVLPIALPPGWGSKTAGLGQRMMWKKITGRCRSVEALVVTSPHYLPLLNLVPEDTKTIYYASDDYRSYEGWGNMAELEKRIVERADHSFFISDALAERVRAEYAIDSARISVSMNATEKRFFPEVEESLPLDPPSGTFVRPIVGVVGGINDRLDFELLQACTECPELGTLLLVGSLPNEPSVALQKLLGHPKTVSVGAQPHEEIHQWFQGLDVGLIPYRKTEFNHFCSPMRLFDHLATGLPLVVTDACDQVREFADYAVCCSDHETFIDALKKQLSENTSVVRPEEKKLTWEARASALLSVIRNGS
ncbi:MAG: glycosyltransferase [Kiritimatiellaceae bacterium]|nr:glycosyltransferase [Kiritimatiellaceae bacterium]